jgi:hypothetical protein
MAPPSTSRPRPVRARFAGLLCTALVVTGCTGDPADPEEPAASPVPSASVGSSATLHAKPVPAEVTVGRVLGGRLSRQQRRRVTQQVTGVLNRYVEGAFLGDYPRGGFSAAFADFSREAARKARADRVLLTNAGSGARTETVRPLRKRAVLYVVKPYRNVAGVTARIRVVFRQQLSGAADQRVTVSGRLLLSRTKAGPWEVFGYDVARTSTPAGKGARR